MKRIHLQELINDEYDHLLKELSNDELDGLIETIKRVKQERKKDYVQR